MRSTGEILRELRRESGLSQSLAAEKANICRLTLWQLETNRSSPSISVAWALADLYGVTVDYLIGRSENRN